MKYSTGFAVIFSLIFSCSSASANEETEVGSLATIYQLGTECDWQVDQNFVRDMTGRTLSADPELIYDFVRAIAESSEWVQTLSEEDRAYVCGIVEDVFTVVEESNSLSTE